MKFYTLLRALNHHSARHQQRTFLSLVREGSTEQYSFQEVQERSLYFAEQFMAIRPKPGSVAFIVLKHRAELYFAFLGAMYSGLIPSFLPFPTPKQDKDLYWSSHRALFARVQPGLVLTYGDNMQAMRSSLDDPSIPLVDVDSLPPLNGHFSPIGGRSEMGTDVALLQHSSGTTGLKKGVILTFSDVKRQAQSYAERLRLTDADVVVSWLPLYHDMGLLSSFLIPLTVGARIVAVDAFEWVSRPSMLLDLIQQERGTFSWLPNFAFNHLVRTRPSLGSYDLSSIRALIGCSEPCKPATYNSFSKCYADSGVSLRKLGACYAMAETVFAATQTTIGVAPRVLYIDGTLLDRNGTIRLVDGADSSARAFLSNGTAVDGLQIRIRAASETISLATGASSQQCGEIQIRGDFVTAGYYKNAEATTTAFEDGWYKTGDIGFCIDGELYVCGRLKEVLIVHGRNYYANDIETVVSDVEGVKAGRAVAFAIFNDRTQSEEAIVVAELENASTADRSAIRRAIKQTVFDALELSLQAVELVEQGWLVKTTSGKISRKENMEKYLARTK